jgi:SOS-response transcriptional repressor LexA
MKIQTMEDPLTPRQRQILDWIVEQNQRSGAPPTRAEIASAFVVVTPAQAGVQKGLVERVASA